MDNIASGKDDPARTAFGDWDGSIVGARALQARLAATVSLEDDFVSPPRLIAGFDVGFEDGGETTRAAAVLLDARSDEVLHARIARLSTSMPYVPGCCRSANCPRCWRCWPCCRTRRIWCSSTVRASPIRAGWGSPPISA